ncbi:MAG TPA: methyltransferase domain-containing protein [Anaerolineae bacterium]|nr:methyltransferase domain-containing protein [Anaerolineae bacterium]
MSETTRSLPSLGRLYLWATHRLYNELAWSYDLAAWIVSAGRWDRWRRMALDYVAQQPVLEVGFGTGELLLAMAGRGWQPVGIDLSPAMQRQTAAKLRRRGLSVPRLQGRAQRLPFADASFGSVIATFPAEYIVDPASLAEFRRVLRPGGRLIVAGLFVSLDVDWPRSWRWLNRQVFGAASTSPLGRVEQRAAEAGLSMQVLWRDDPPWQVPIIVAEKPL